MKLNRSARHQQARQLLEQGDVAKVTLEGKEVSKAEALDALKEDAGLDAIDAGAFAEKLDAFEDKLKDVQLGIPGTELKAKIGKWSLDALELAPDESIKSTQKLVIERANGERLELDAEAIDLKSSAFLKKVSAWVNGGSAMPFMVGTVIGYGAGAISAVAAVGAHAMGKQKWGSALLRMATKHLILSTVTNLPVAGNLACVLCAARDARDQARMSKSASVQDSVNLAQHGKATLPPEPAAAGAPG
jgi:hypothetical protein